ncbi:MAG: hypothetical protein R3C28_23590 [Pirellulaceae bacterium]
MVLMLLMPAWAMLWNLFNVQSGWIGGDGREPNYSAVAFGLFILGLQAWMMLEVIL